MRGQRTRFVSSGGIQDGPGIEWILAVACVVCAFAPGGCHSGTAQTFTIVPGHGGSPKEPCLFDSAQISVQQTQDD